MEDLNSYLSRESKWAEIDLDALAHNVSEIRRKTGDKVRIAAVSKANCYGHGIANCFRALLDAGVDQFAVAVLNEALELRNITQDADILVLGSMPIGTEEQSIEANLQHTVTSFEKAKAISDAAVKLGKTAKIHIKLDTGMTRLGFMPGEESMNEVVKISKLPNIELEGIFTHFARADESSKKWAYRQYRLFTRCVDNLKSKGVEFKIKHVANSAAIMEMPDTYNDMVRPGIILFGIYPSDEVDKAIIDIKPVMTFKTRITHLKKLTEDRQVSYNGRYTAMKGDIIGTIAVGYADGYTRAQSGKAEVLYRGKRVKIVGNICMDMCMVDLSDFPDAKVGDEVVLFGRSGNAVISAQEVAERYGTIGYEVICGLGIRVPRYYIKGGRLVSKVDYLEQGKSI